MDVYANKGDQIFKASTGLSTFLQIVMFTIIFLFFTGIFYMIGKNIYDNEKVKEDFEKMRMTISNEKSKLKGQELKFEDIRN